MNLDNMLLYLFNPQIVKNQINRSHRMETKSLLITRLIILIYMTVVITQTFVTDQIDFINYFIYLTYWGSFITFAFFIFAVTENISFLRNDQNQFFQDSLWQFTHILFTLSFCLEVPIFLMFWGYIYPNLDNPTTSQLISFINLHGGFFMCILFDELINDIQFVIRHIYVLAGVTLLYGLVNFTYVRIQQRVIYPGMTWMNALSYIMIIMTLIIIILAFFGGHLFYGRVKKYRIENGLLNTEGKTIELQTKQGQQQV